MAIDGLYYAITSSHNLAVHGLKTDPGIIQPGFQRYIQIKIQSVSPTVHLLDNKKLRGKIHVFRLQENILGINVVIMGYHKMTARLSTF